MSLNPKNFTEKTAQAIEKAQQSPSADVVGIGLDKVFKPREA